MSTGGLDKRIKTLEEDLVPDPEAYIWNWDPTDQMESVIDALRIHRTAGTVQLATDREIHLTGLLCAREELPGDFGEYRFPSRKTVVWYDNEDGTCGARASEMLRVEDLPESVREYFERMDPDKQPERELWLYNDRHRAREHRERMKRWEAEGAFDRVTPTQTTLGRGEGGSY